MPIVSSTLVAERPQKDGRFWVTETHVFGDVPPAPMTSPIAVTYLAGSKDDPNLILAGHAADLNAQEAVLASEVPIATPTILASVNTAVAALGPKDLAALAQTLGVATFTVNAQQSQQAQQAQVGV